MGQLLDFYISTHAPLAGRDNISKYPKPALKIFQPTRPLRGATLRCTEAEPDGQFQPTRPLRGATACDTTAEILCKKFQPTRPLRGATNVSPNQSIIVVFQPTRPLRGATTTKPTNAVTKIFQPTRPLRGATGLLRSRSSFRGNFNPRAPCGARPRSAMTVEQITYFNPRAPCGARQQKSTNHYAHFCDNRQISDAFAQNAACQGILLLFDAGKPCGFWVRTAQVISAHLCFAL